MSQETAIKIFDNRQVRTVRLKKERNEAATNCSQLELPPES